MFLCLIPTLRALHWHLLPICYGDFKTKRRSFCQVVSIFTTYIETTADALVAVVEFAFPPQASMLNYWAALCV